MKRLGLAGAIGFIIITNIGKPKLNEVEAKMPCEYKNTPCGKSANYELNKGDDIRVLTRDFCDLAEGHKHCFQYSVNKMWEEKK